MAEAHGKTAAALPAAPGTVAEQSANPLEDVESIFGHAFKHPQLNLMAMWEF